MSDNTIMMLRLPKALKAQVDAEARRFGITTSELIRKKLQAVTLPDVPVVRMLEGRVKGVRIIRVEIPMKVGSEPRYKSPRVAKGRKMEAGAAIEKVRAKPER